ncbi:MAG: glycosyltransferase family 39 protein [Thermodesulfobacteriota bacterium]
MKSPNHPILRIPRGIDVGLVIIFALAVLFRLSDLGARNLWTDEAWVALAALKPTPAEALAAGQSTPPLYLLTLWVMAQVWGSSEAILRSLSFLFGLGTVFLFWPLARRLVSPRTALLALAAVALSPVLVYFSKELKQYSGDAFFAVALILLTERLRASQGEGGWLALALAGLLGLGFSHALIFTLPVLAAVLWLGLPPAARPRLALLGAVWILGFAVFYLFFFRTQVDPELVNYWTQDFPDFSGPLAFFRWAGGALYRYLQYFLLKGGFFWGLPLLLIGVLAWWGQGPRCALLYWGGPLLLALAAAVLHRYPFMAHYGGNRLMLFSAPLLYLATATGVAVSLSWLWRQRYRWLAPVLAGLILIALNPREIVRENLHTSLNQGEIRPLITHLQSQLQPQDRVYVYYYAINPFKYYFHGNLDQVCWGKSCVETGWLWPEVGDSSHRRLWLLSTHYPSLKYMQEFAARLLGPGWRQTACLKRPGAVLFRFDWQGPVEANRQTLRSGPSLSGSPTPTLGRVCE